MKYYSDITEKVYNTEEDLKIAEKGFLASKAEEEKKGKSLTDKGDSEKSAVSARKKELSTDIREQERAVTAAYKQLEEAKKTAQKIMAQARHDADEVIKEATEVLNNEISIRKDLIKQFNEEFGPYTVTYTGERAEEEYYKALNRIKALFESNPFFLFPSWFSDFGF